MLDAHTAYLVEILLGGLFVLFDGRSRFNQLVEPQRLSALRLKNLVSDSRSSTTALSFFGALAIYQLILLGAYSLLLLNRQWLELIVRYDPSGRLPVGLSPALLSALVLVVVLPRVNLVSSVEKKVRGWLQRLASIPHELIKVTHDIQGYEWRADNVKQTQANGDGLEVDGVGVGGPLLSPRLHQVQVLLEAVQGWKGKKDLVTYLIDYQEILDQLQADETRVRKSADLCRESAAQFGSDHRLVQEHRSHLEEQAGDLLQAVCTFIAGGLLRCCHSHGARRAELEELGFVIPERHLVAAVGMGKVVLALLLTFMALIVILASSGELVDGPARLLQRAGMFASTAVGAILTAVLVWDKTRRKEREPSGIWDRPYHLYLLAAAIALGAGLVLGLLFRLGELLRDPATALAAFRAAMPYHLITAAQGFGTALLLDDNPGRFLTGWRLRLLEGGALAAFVSFFGLVAYWWLGIRLGRVGLGGDVPPFAVYAGLVGGMNFLAGAFIPHWCRAAVVGRNGKGQKAGGAERTSEPAAAQP